MSGVAGYGKTHIVKQDIESTLEAMYGSNYVWMTASTGMAALGLDGSTIPSAAGIGLGTGSVATIIKEMKEAARQRWRTVKAIVIEECSMISSTLLDKLHGGGMLEER